MKEKLVSFLPFASRVPRAWFERDSRGEGACVNCACDHCSGACVPECLARSSFKKAKEEEELRIKRRLCIVYRSGELSSSTDSKRRNVDLTVPYCFLAG